MDAPANNQTLEERIYNISDLNINQTLEERIYKISNLNINQTLEERIYNISDLNKQSDSGGTDLQHFRPKFRNCFNSILSGESRGCPKKVGYK